jgi:hypothetical protein
MRNLDPLIRYRLHLPDYVEPDQGNGAFQIPSPTGEAPLRVIASSGGGWDHVSVSTQGRCPTWQEMEFVRRMFFHDDEAVMQLHPPLADYVNDHPHCLHLWRPQRVPVPRPPRWMVGGMSEAEAEAAMRADGVIQ